MGQIAPASVHLHRLLTHVTRSNRLRNVVFHFVEIIVFVVLGVERVDSAAHCINHFSLEYLFSFARS